MANQLSDSSDSNYLDTELLTAFRGRWYLQFLGGSIFETIKSQRPKVSSSEQISQMHRETREIAQINFGNQNLLFESPSEPEESSFSIPKQFTETKEIPFEDPTREISEDENEGDLDSNLNRAKNQKSDQTDDSILLAPEANVPNEEYPNF